MAIGDITDIQGRLQKLIPNGWFPNGITPIRDGLLAGFASVFAFIYQLLAYLRLQTRISTATDGFLDLIARDFFGGNLVRASGQSDLSFRAQIIALLFRQRCTREAIILVIQQLLGTTPTIIEPQRATDTGGYSEPTAMGYGVAGAYGSLSMPLQCFVTISVPGGVGAPPMVGGYGSYVGGYTTGSQLEYVSLRDNDTLEDSDIYAALDSVRPVTGIIWARLVPET